MPAGALASGQFPQRPVCHARKAGAVKRPFDGLFVPAVIGAKQTDMGKPALAHELRNGHFIRGRRLLRQEGKLPGDGAP